MIEDKIKVFIEGVENFFININRMNVTIGTPYLIENEHPQASDYTGVIGISGEYTGCVYFTAPGHMLKHLLLSYGVTSTNISKERVLDLVGEVANTISGNARAEYGQTFNISVPVVFEGAPKDVYLPKDAYSYVIPIVWKKYTAHIVVSLQK